MKRITLLVLIGLSMVSLAYSAPSVKEDAEDGDTVGWSVYDNKPGGSAITNEYDDEAKSRVIKLYAPGGQSNGFKFIHNKDYNKSTIRWSMKHWNDIPGYVVYVSVGLVSGEKVKLTYDINHDVEDSVYRTTGCSYIYKRMEIDVEDGNWHTITKDLQEDMRDADGAAPGFEGFKNKRIAYVNGLYIRGNFLIDNIILDNDVAQVSLPQTMRFQGMLKDASGNPLTDDSCAVAFRIYDAAAEGTVLWEETYDGLNVQDGFLDVELGSKTDLDLPFDAQYWLGVRVESDDEMSPRFKLSAVPYAFNSEN